MGIMGLESEKEELDTSEIESMIEERTAARKARDFAKSDAIRDQLAEKGIILEDTPILLYHFIKFTKNSSRFIP